MTDERSRLDADLAALRDLPLFVAYNANVDAVVRVDERLEAALDRPPETPEEAVPSGRLASKRDLAAAITRTMRSGEGDERITTTELADELESTLTPDATQMGGQAGIMSDLLASLGAAPVVYTYLLSETQRSMFGRPEAVRYPLVEDGRVRFVPVDDAPTADRTKINWIFEFEAGAELFGVRATGATRFIAASRPPEFDLRAGALDAVADQVGAQVEGALLAGYHNLTPEHADGGYEETLRHARDVLRRLRSDREIPVHVEYAVTHDEDLQREITETILPEADVVGLDARELGMLTADLDLDVETGDDAAPERAIVDHYRALSALVDRLGVGCVRLHAMDYHLAVVGDYLAPDAVGRGLEFAAINAAAKAATGEIAGTDALEAGVACEPSVRGREAVESLADAVGATAEDGALTTPSVVARPNRVVDDPAGTVGIGDIVSASSFALEVALASAADE